MEAFLRQGIEERRGEERTFLSSRMRYVDIHLYHISFCVIRIFLKKYIFFIFFILICIYNCF